MRAAVLDGHGSIDIADLLDPTSIALEIVIAPKAVGTCGTDIRLATGDYPTATIPVVPRHEFAGTVTAVGDAVTRFAVGDRICADPNVDCGHGVECCRGATNLCENLYPIGVTVNGACAEIVVVPEKVVFALPDGIDWTTGALIEPLACVLNAFGRIGPSEFPILDHQ